MIICLADFTAVESTWKGVTALCTAPVPPHKCKPLRTTHSPTLGPLGGSLHLGPSFLRRHTP